VISLSASGKHLQPIGGNQEHDPSAGRDLCDRLDKEHDRGGGEGRAKLGHFGRRGRRYECDPTEVDYVILERRRAARDPAVHLEEFRLDAEARS